VQSGERSAAVARRLLASRIAATLVVLIAAGAIGILLFGIVRGLTFVADEWAFITARRDPSLEAVLAPYNNHWQAIPILAYEAALGLRGLGAFSLLAAIGVAGHLFAGIALFVALRNVRPWLAATAAIALLAFAWSDEVLLWPINLAFTLPVAFGFTAIALWTTDQPRAWRDAAGMLALVGGFISGGVAIPMAAVATGVLFAESKDRRRLAWPAAAWAVYLLWFVVLGRSGDALGNAQSSDLTLLAEFVARGLSTVAAPALGLTFRFQEAALVGIVAALAVVAGRFGVRPLRGWIAIGGVVFLYAVIGAARLKNYDVDGSQAPRYLYPAFALLLFGVATIADRLFDVIRSEPARRILAVGIAAWLVVSLVGDAGKLARSAQSFGDRAGVIRTDLSLLQVLRPAIEAGAAGGVVIDEHQFGRMTPAAYYAVVDDLGPLPVKPGSPHLWPPPERERADRLLAHLFGAELGFQEVPGVPIRTVDSAERRYGLHDMTNAIGDAGCASFTVTGDDPYVALRLLDGESLAIRTDGQRTLQVFERVLTDDFGAIVKSIQPVPGTWYAVKPPALGRAFPWRLRVDAPPRSSRLDICLIPAGSAP
jgi:hypothetical protein